MLVRVVGAVSSPTVQGSAVYHSLSVGSQWTVGLDWWGVGGLSVPIGRGSVNCQSQLVGGQWTVRTNWWAVRPDHWTVGANW